MKYLNRSIFLLVLVTFSNITLSNSTGNKNHFKNMKKITLKCDVVYVGGTRSIHYHYDLPIKLRSTFENDLLKIDNPSKGKVYRVNQCVEINNKFNDGIANSLEKELESQG